MTDKYKEIEDLNAKIEALRRKKPSQTAVLELQSAILAGRRDFAAKELAEVVSRESSEEALQELAESPLERAQVAKIWAGLAGLAEKHEVDITKQMSDSQMRAKLREMGIILPDDKFPHEIEASVEAEAETENDPEKHQGDS